MLTRLTTLSRRTKQLILLWLDILLVPASLLVSMAVSSSTIPFLQEIRAELPAMILLSIAAGFISVSLGLPRVQLKSYELSALGRSAALGGMLAGMLAMMVLLGQSNVEAGTPVILALIYSVFSATSRLVLLQILLALYRKNVDETRVLIYGAGKTGIQLAMALKSTEDVRLLGFLDDNSVLHGMTVAGQTVYPAQRIEALIQSQNVDKVLLAMPSLSQPRQAQIARRVAKMKVEVQTLPSFAQLIGQEEIVDKLAPVLPNQVLGRKHLKDALDGGCTAYRGRSVMITGAGGSIGSEICRQILSCKPERLVLLELTEFALFSIDRELRALAEDTGTEIVPILGSVTDARLVDATIRAQGVQVILHAAAYKHVPMVEKNPLAGISNNVFGTQIVAMAALENKIERFVLVSTDKAVRPLGVMGATKRMAELIVGDCARRSKDTVFAMVRFGNVLGSSGSVVPIFYDQVSRGGPVTVTDPEVTRYFMTIQEACRLVLWAGTLSEGGEIFVLDMGKPVKIVDLARQVIEAAGYSVQDKDNPDGDIEVITTGLREGEKLHEELTVSPRLSQTAHPKLSCAREELLTEFEIIRALQALRGAVEVGEADAAVGEMMHWLKRDLDNNLRLAESLAQR
ncbi:polysaccharide biosynthesis protein [Rhodobacter sp. NTK016B]|uniref:polysaccharide biosynthesis protein n=1 Tax=Rhodobacter sp. NTK016B TaxID=2759676 RepID=UPI001A8D483E|nr:nucleoside-diphosphate sugar epimerase/dehydratase [Rhodobacter sp. NTK016B]MBN8292996.1 polysaccharide biosynthesis protein [Rhodobacter sp. NTK016B]